MRAHALYLYLLLLLACAGSAQSTVFRNYSVTSGLPSSEVYKVFQDSKGYMWFCTDAGVCRYDGYSYRSFTSEHGLPDNTVFDLYEDKKGRVWFFGMAKKLAYYSPASDSIFTIACNDSLSWRIDNSSITSLYSAGDTLFLGVNSGSSFFKIPPSGNYKNIIRMRFKDAGWQVYCFGDKSLVWGTTGPHQGFSAMQMSVYKSGKLSAQYKGIDSQKVNNIERYRRLVKTKEGILFSENSELFYQEQNSLAHTGMQSAIISIYMDKAGDIWCGTKSNGVYRYKNGDLASAPAHYLAQISISSIVQDREGGYWFSTLEHGVYYAPSFVFSYYDQSSGLSGSKIFSVLSHEQGVFCCSEDGSLNLIRDASVTVEKQVKGAHVYSVAPGNSLLVIAGENSCLYDPATKRRQAIWKDPQQRPFYLRKLSVYGGKIYGIISNGLCAIDLKTSEVDYLVQDRHRLTAVYAGHDTVWFGNSNGLFYYAGHTVTFTGNKNPLLKNRVDDICMDRRHNLWLATKGAGILVKRGGQISQITVKNGLRSNLCKTLLMDSGNVVWVGTNRGISRITWLHDTVYAIENYSSFDGLLSDEINQLSMSGNNIYAATNQGVIRFDKTTLRFDKTPPPVYISGFYVNDMKQAPAPAYALDYNENFIRITFLGLSYKAPGSLTYKYRLMGLDSAWKYTPNTNVEFTTLPPGDYSFEMYAISQERVQSEAPALLCFHINPPYWKTWWFITGSSLLLGLCIYLVFSARIRRIKKTESEKTVLNKKIAEVELKAIRAQMNPHFIFNSINSIQLYILMNDADTAYRYLSKFSRLIRNVLENSKHELISLQTEIETLELYIELEKLRFETKFEHQIHIDPQIDPLLYAIPPLLIQPYIENAIWHGLMPKQTKGTLTIRFMDAGGLIKCVVEDDGIGRERSEALKANNRPHHRSLALSLNKERLEMIGYFYQNKLQISITDMKDNSGEPAGTSVELYIPKIKFNSYDNSNNS